MTQRWRRFCLRTGMIVCLLALLLYGLEVSHRPIFHLLQQASTHYQAQRYQEAIDAYQHMLDRTATLPLRITLRFLPDPLRPPSVLLQIANCHYRLAEAELHHYHRAARDPRLTPRPSLSTVQRLLTVARQAYSAVPDTLPRVYMAAQTNGARVATWQLMLAAFDEQSPGRQSLRQQTIQAIHQAATAVDYAYRERNAVQYEERMHAMLLLETLTAFSEERPLPTPSPSQVGRGRLGDLLLQHGSELSPQERQRFQDFFFALPLEAQNPWPTDRQGGAGSGQSPVAH